MIGTEVIFKDYLRAIILDALHYDNLWETDYPIAQLFDTYKLWNRKQDVDDFINFCYEEVKVLYNNNEEVKEYFMDLLGELEE